MDKLYNIYIKKDEETKRSLYLESKCYCNSDNEKEKWHHKISQGASIPWRMIDAGIYSSGIIDQYHQLQANSNTSMCKAKNYPRFIHIPELIITFMHIFI
jgi:hypothetical protein